MSWVAVGVAGVGLVTSGVKAISAGKAEKKAKQEADATHRPFFKVQDEYYQNKNIAEEQAGGGIPQGTKDYLDTERKRGLSSSLEALQSGGVDPSVFGRLLSGYNESLGQEAGADSQQHVQNIQYFMQANKDIAGQKTTGFGLNELQPFENKLKEITERRAAAQQNEMNAIDEGIGSIGSAAGALSSDNYFNKLFGKTDPYGNFGDKGGFSKYGNNETVAQPSLASNGGQPVSNFADRYSSISDQPSKLLADQDSNLQEDMSTIE